VSVVCSDERLCFLCTRACYSAMQVLLRSSSRDDSIVQVDQTGIDLTLPPGAIRLLIDAEYDIELRSSQQQRYSTLLACLPHI
jgi:hypothetical protein